MQRKERRKKFHDSLLSMLYARPPSPPHQKEFDEEALNKALEAYNVDHIHDESIEERRFSSSSSSESELGDQKLTRAQRKRLRKKKLKEAASQCRKIIGPQLPNTDTTSNDQVDGDESAGNECQPEGVVRQSAPNEVDHEQGGELDSSSKLKHRRIAKKEARERSKPFIPDCPREGRREREKPWPGPLTSSEK